MEQLDIMTRPENAVAESIPGIVDVLSAAQLEARAELNDAEQQLTAIGEIRELETVRSVIGPVFVVEAAKELVAKEAVVNGIDQVAATLGIQLESATEQPTE